MLVRNSPFKEWVTVYFDPEKTNESKLLEFLRARRCPSARLDRIEQAGLTAMNPFVGPGGVVQLRWDYPNGDQPPELTLPSDWVLKGSSASTKENSEQTEQAKNAEQRFYSIQVPTNTRSGQQTISAVSPDGKTYTVTVEVVRRVG